jgi:hypothetical protein
MSLVMQSPPQCQELKMVQFDQRKRLNDRLFPIEKRRHRYMARIGLPKEIHRVLVHQHVVRRASDYTYYMLGIGRHQSRRRIENYLLSGKIYSFTVPITKRNTQ